MLGQVTNIGIEYDPKSRNFMMPVTLNLYPDRLGKQAKPGAAGTGHERQAEDMLQRLVDARLRGQLRTGNLLTSQLYIALDFFPKAHALRRGQYQR